MPGGPSTVFNAYDVNEPYDSGWVHLSTHRTPEGAKEACRVYARQLRGGVSLPVLTWRDREFDDDDEASEVGTLFSDHGCDRYAVTRDELRP